MHLIPDHDRVGVEFNSSLATVWQGGNTPTAIRTADGAVYPRRAWASVSRRTPAEQERENWERTVLRKKWDTDKLVQAGESSFCPVPCGDERSSPTVLRAIAALLGVAIDQAGDVTAEERKYILHHYKACPLFLANTLLLEES